MNADHDSNARKLPIYLVLDCSGSMNGDPIESVRQGVNYLLSELRGDPQALETVWLSVITFDSRAQQVVPLTPIDRFSAPQFDARGTTALGHALDVLVDAVEREVRRAGPEQKGDWKPMIFLMTDGVPTDPWEQQADRIKAHPPGRLVVVGAGSQVNESTLKRLSDESFMMRDYTPDTFKAFFKWVSASIQVASHKAPEHPGAHASSTTTSSTLPPPPPQIQLIP